MKFSSIRIAEITLRCRSIIHHAGTDGEVADVCTRLIRTVNTIAFWRHCGEYTPEAAYLELAGVYRDVFDLAAGSHPGVQARLYANWEDVLGFLNDLARESKLGFTPHEEARLAARADGDMAAWMREELRVVFSPLPFRYRNAGLAVDPKDEGPRLPGGIGNMFWTILDRFRHKEVIIVQTPEGRRYLAELIIGAFLRMKGHGCACGRTPETCGGAS